MAADRQKGTDDVKYDHRRFPLANAGFGLARRLLFPVSMVNIRISGKIPYNHLLWPRSGGAMLENLNVDDQFPQLTSSELAQIESLLSERFDYPSIPADLKGFLLQHNGCLLSSTEADVEVGIPLDAPFLEFAPVAGIFGVWQSRFYSQKPLHKEWPELFASNENSKENFSVLPERMMSFAYEHRDSGSLFAISVDERDYGVVYFYYDQHIYSIFGQKRSIDKVGYCYYEQAIQSILERHELSEDHIDALKVGGEFDLDHILDDPFSLTDACVFDLSRAMFIQVAPSFDEFMNRLETFG